MKISKSEFAARRKRLMSEMAPNSVAIIPAAREVTRSRDTEYPFRQNSDFFYLTGFKNLMASFFYCQEGVGGKC